MRSPFLCPTSLPPRKSSRGNHSPPSCTSPKKTPNETPRGGLHSFTLPTPPHHAHFCQDDTDTCGRADLRASSRSEPALPSFLPPDSVVLPSALHQFGCCHPPGEPVQLVPLAENQSAFCPARLWVRGRPQLVPGEQWERVAGSQAALLNQKSSEQPTKPHLRSSRHFNLLIGAKEEDGGSGSLS